MTSVGANTGQLSATVHKGATLGPGRQPWSKTLTFNGIGNSSSDGQHVSIDGGTEIGGGELSICANVKYDSFGYFSRIVDFGNAQGSDNIILYNTGKTSTLEWTILQGSSIRYILVQNFWEIGEWVHACVSIDASGKMRAFKNGVEMNCTSSDPQDNACDSEGVGSNGHLPKRIVRKNSFIGRSNWGHDAYFNGSISDLAIIDGHAVTINEEAIGIMHGHGDVPTDELLYADKKQHFGQYVGCYQDCSTDGNGAEMNRVCDDTEAYRFRVERPDECAAFCKGYKYMALACPRDGIECWCCNTLDTTSTGTDGKIKDAECATDYTPQSGVNANSQGTCYHSSGLRYMDGFALGGHCRAAVYSTGECIVDETELLTTTAPSTAIALPPPDAYPSYVYHVILRDESSERAITSPTNKHHAYCKALCSSKPLCKSVWAKDDEDQCSMNLDSDNKLPTPVPCASTRPSPSAASPTCIGNNESNVPYYYTDKTVPGCCEYKPWIFNGVWYCSPIGRFAAECKGTYFRRITAQPAPVFCRTNATARTTAIASTNPDDNSIAAGTTTPSTNSVNIIGMGIREEDNSASNAGLIAGVVVALLALGIAMAVIFRRKKGQSAKAAAAVAEWQEDEDRRNTIQMEANPHVAALKAKKQAALSSTSASTVHNKAFVGLTLTDIGNGAGAPAIEVDYTESHQAAASDEYIGVTGGDGSSHPGPTDQPWFVRGTDRGECKARVAAAKQKGAFLVRISRHSPGGYVFCINLGNGRVQEDLAKPDSAGRNLALYFANGKKKATPWLADLPLLVKHCQTNALSPKADVTLQLGNAAPPLPTDTVYALVPSASDAVYSCLYGEVDSGLLNFYNRVVVANHEIYDALADNPLAALASAPDLSLADAIGKAENHCGPLTFVLDEAEMFAAENVSQIQLSNPDISDEVVKTVFAYTRESDLYKKMNAALGNYGSDADPRSNLVDFLPFVKLLKHSLSLLPKRRPGIVYRGVKRPYTDLLNGASFGGTLTWFSFTSTTADPKVLRKKEFLNATVNIDPVTKAVSSVKNLGIYGAAAQPSGKTIFQIHTINGVNISPFSAEEDEDEIILPAGSTFRITGINDWHDGITEVRLREIDDDDGGKDDFQQDPLYMNINQYMAVDPPNAAVTNVYDIVDSPPSYTSLGAHDSSA